MTGIKYMDNDANLESKSTAPQEPHHNKWLASFLLVLILMVGSFRLGLTAGRKGLTFSPKEFKVINQNDQTALVDYSLLWQAIKTVSDKYIEKDSIDQRKILYGAVRGAVTAAGDEYTTFFDPEDYSSFKTDLSGSFDGIGAEIGKKDGNLVIVAPLDGSPAAKAGLKAKDIILKVDGQSTLDWSVEDAVRKIRGAKGTAVTLTVFREGNTKPQEFKIIRDTITVKSVKLDYKTVNGKKIAVLTLSRFGNDTKALFNDAINQILSSSAQGLVLDLRNDPGGFLETAVDVASNWVPKDKLVVTESQEQGKKNIPYNSYGYNRLANIKTVILINGGSASASEILAGALHDYNIAKLIGEKSFGKGSVQEVVDLPYNTAVKVTVAKWITPSGKNLNKDGLHPDIEVKITDADAAAGRDPQLDKALEEVTK